MTSEVEIVIWRDGSIVDVGNFVANEDIDIPAAYLDGSQWLARKARQADDD